MAIKKQQKRSIEESQSVPQNGPAAKKSQKPFKKMKTEKPAQESVQKPVQKPVNNGVQGKKIKIEKKTAVDQPKKAKKEIPAANLEAKNAAKRLKNAEKLKKKNENRAEARKTEGQYKADKITMTPEEIELRIKDIRSRPELTKTAKRKLALLKKRLQIAQGTFVPKPKPDSEESKLSKNKRRALRKKTEAAKRLALGQTPGSKVNAKSEGVVKGKKGSIVVKVETIKPENIGKAVKKPQQVKSKEAKKIVLKKEEPEDSEDDDDEEEEEDDSDDEADVSGSILNTTEEEDDDDDDDEEEDDDDDDDDEEEEEEEVKVPVKKVKKEQEKKQPVKKEIKKEAVQNGDAGKKKRFVLFVGNLPFTATAEEIKQHFLTKVSSVSSVRVPTRPGSNDPRGFAYVEVDNQTDYEKGLSLQGTTLNGRRLNVEYSQGGSKTVGKRPEIVAKNKKLHAMRKQGMLAGSQRDGHKRNDRRQKQKQGPA